MNEKNNISNFEDFLSEKTLLKYINNELSDEENKKIELILQENEMYSDIIDGLLLMEKPEDINIEIRNLNKKIDAFSRNTKKQADYKYYKYRSIAAIILVLIVSGGVLFYINKLEKESKSNNQFAAIEKQKHDEPANIEELNSKYEIEENIIEQNKIEHIQNEEPEQIIEELVVVEDDVEVADINIDTEASEKTATAAQIVGNIEIEEVVEPVQFAVVEEIPKFPGGEAALMKFIHKNTVYPPAAKEKGIQGRVYVQFVIDVDGNPTKVSVARSVDPDLDAEAMRVVSLMKGWSPGKQRGKPVPVYYIIPINFRLE